MIGSLRGKITFKTDKFLIIETGRVGYKVSVSPDLLLQSKKMSNEVSLWIHTVVREDALDLYGFLSREDLDFFELLLGVSGIGPRSALAILGVASIDTLRRAISTGDTGYLTKVYGIGRKTAEKIVVELRDKVGEDKTGSSLEGEMDALEALKSLGYSQHEAREALKKVSLGHSPTGEAPDLSTNAKIKDALKVLGGR